MSQKFVMHPNKTVYDMARPFVKHLETLITNGETPMALHVLLDFLSHKEQSLSESFAELIAEDDTSLRKICIMQQSALSDNENELHLGLLEENEYDKAVNRTSYTLLSLLPQYPQCNRFQRQRLR